MVHAPNSTAKHPPLVHLEKITAIIFDEKADPRTVAILTASYLEHYLTDVIASYLPGLNSELREKLFDSGRRGILSELGAKIDMARALGAMDGGRHRDCIVVARIRNRFAHRLDVESFEHQEISDLVKKLTDRGVRGPAWIEGTEKFEGTLRGKFLWCALELCAVLSNALHPQARKIYAAHAPLPSK